MANRYLAIAGLALCVGLAGCGQRISSQPVAHAVEVGNKPARCLTAGDMNIYQPGTELKGAVRAKLLTPAANAAGVRIFISSTEINQYGNVVLNYVDARNTCTLWSEGLTLQEYSQKLGLNPVGISPYYEPDAPKPVPTPSPTPTATPSPSGR